MFDPKWPFQFSELCGGEWLVVNEYRSHQEAIEQIEFSVGFASLHPSFTAPAGYRIEWLADGFCNVDEYLV